MLSQACSPKRLRSCPAGCRRCTQVLPRQHGLPCQFPAPSPPLPRDKPSCTHPSQHCRKLLRLLRSFLGPQVQPGLSLLPASACCSHAVRGPVQQGGDGPGRRSHASWRAACHAGGRAGHAALAGAPRWRSPDPAAAQRQRRLARLQHCRRLRPEGPPGRLIAPPCTPAGMSCQSVLAWLSGPSPLRPCGPCCC